MRRVLHIFGLTLLALSLGALFQPAFGQYPGGGGYPGGYPGGGMPGRGMGPSPSLGDDESAKPATTEKSTKVAMKFFNAGMKSLAKVREYEEESAKATTEDKKGALRDKIDDGYGRALDQFTEALRNDSTLADAWNNVGYVHLKLGAFNEAIDDYNHVLAVKPDLLEAIEHRGEAFMAMDRLEDAQASYMDLYNHSRPLADQLMASMEKWLESHRTSPNGMRAADIDAFGKWVAEREGIAKQSASTASTP